MTISAFGNGRCTPILVKDAQHKLSQTNFNGGVRILNFDSGSTIGCVKRLSASVSPTVVVDGSHKTKLAKEHNKLLKR